MKLRIILALFLIPIARVAAEADLNFLKLDSDTGLEFVDDMHRDRSGYLWVATAREGLARFDGYSVKSYRVDPDDETSISSNITTCVLEDSDGVIWVSANNGINRLNRETGVFRRYVSGLSSEHASSPERVFWMIESSSGVIWGLTRRALHRYNPDTDDFTRFDIGKQIGDGERLRHMAEDSDGSIWVVCSTSELLRFDPASGTFSRFPNPNVSFNSMGRERIEIDGRSIWMAIERLGLMRFDKISKRYTLYPIDAGRSGNGTMSSSVCDVVSLDANTLAVGVDQGGICLLDKVTGEFSYFDSLDDGVGGLTTNGVVRLYKDPEGILWAGTSRGGVFFQNPNHVPFVTFWLLGPKGQGYSKAIVGAVFEDSRGFIWIGTDGNGFSIMNLDTGEATPFSTANSGLSSDVIRRFAEDRNGDIWIATWDGGLNKFEWKTGEVSEVGYSAEIREDLRREGLWGVTIDGKGRVWLSNDFSFRLLDENLDLIAEMSVRDGGVGQRLVYVYEDGAIYASDWDGVYRFDESKLEMLTVVEGARIMQMARDQDGLLCLATLGDGVQVYSPEGELLHRVGLDGGLSSAFLKSIQISNDNALWVGSDFGLNRIDMDTFSVSRFLEEDGLQGNNYFSQASAKLRDGRLAFGGVGGVSFFDPVGVAFSEFNSQVCIEGLKVLNEVVKMSDFSELDPSTGQARVVIPWSSKMISLDFQAVGFTYPKKIRYAYKLDGFDKDWIYTDGGVRSATYTNLPPGRYQFIVKASLGDGVWSEKIARLGVRIVPPFWMTFWFIGLSVLLLALLAYAYLKQREKRLLKEQGRLKAQVEERSNFIAEITVAKNKAEESDRLKTQFLANMSHEIRTPMNAILGFSSLLTDASIEPEDRKIFSNQVTVAAESLLRLIEDILDISMIEADQLKILKEDFPLMNLLEELHSSFLVYPRSEGVNFIYDNQYRLSDLLVTSDRFRVQQILVNLLSNAFKFTRKGSVQMGVRKVEKGLCIFVKDTGEGMTGDELKSVFERFVKLDRHQELAIRGVGLGLAISKRLSDLLGCELTVKSEKGFGSEFSLLILESAIRGEVEDSKDHDREGVEYVWADHTLLVVEDEVSNFLYLKQALKSTQVEVDWAKNGREAVDLFKKPTARYDVVLMDIKMPELDGYSALKEIKDLKPEQVVIAQTAHAMKEDLERIKRAGFDDYLTKPIMRDRLMETVVKYF